MKKSNLFFLLPFIFCISNCSAQSTSAKPRGNDVSKISDYISGKEYDKYGIATFAGGCFWCTEASFERIEGVIDVISGYSGGTEQYPTYKEVAYGKTSHCESIMVYFDPEVINYRTLLEVFFTAHDPTTLNRQGPDVGPHYRSAIFYHDDEQKEAVEKTITRLNKSGHFKDPIVTEVSAFDEFWVAEGYHQDYYEHNPGNSYIVNVSRPKVEKVKKVFANLLKEKYRKPNK